MNPTVYNVQTSNTVRRFWVL